MNLENLAETVWKDVEGTIRDIHKEVIERFGSNEEELSEINIFQPFNPFMYGAPERNPESDDDQLISEGDDVSDIEDVSDGDDTSESDDNGLQGSDSGSEHGAGGSEGGYRSESDDGRERESEKDDLVSNDLSPDRSDRICESPVLPFTGKLINLILLLLML